MISRCQYLVHVRDFSNDFLDFQLFDFRCRYIVDEESQVADPVTRAVSLSLVRTPCGVFPPPIERLPGTALGRAMSGGAEGFWTQGGRTKVAGQQGGEFFFPLRVCLNMETYLRSDAVSWPKHDEESWRFVDIFRFSQTNLNKYERISEKLETCRVDQDAMAMMLAELKHPGFSRPDLGSRSWTIASDDMFVQVWSELWGFNAWIWGSLIADHQCATFHISHASTARWKWLTSCLDDIRWCFSTQIAKWWLERQGSNSQMFIHIHTYSWFSLRLVIAFGFSRWRRGRRCERSTHPEGCCKIRDMSTGASMGNVDSTCFSILYCLWTSARRCEAIIALPPKRSHHDPFRGTRNVIASLSPQGSQHFSSCLAGWSRGDCMAFQLSTAAVHLPQGARKEQKRTEDNDDKDHDNKVTTTLQCGAP